MSDFAPGLPSKTEFKPINPTLKGMTRVVFQRHKATSDHYDMRVLDGDVLHSWVSRSLPGEKDKFLLVQQPTHRADYINFEGVIASGYGAGTVKKAYDEPAEIIKADNDRIRLVLPEGEFSAVRTSGRNWLMIHHKNTLPGAITHKPVMKDIKPADAGMSDPETVWQPKIDGGHMLWRLNSNGINRVYSYKTGKKTGRPIEHTHQLPEFRDAVVPKELDGVEFRGEVYAKNQSGPLPPESVAGLLNSGTFRSRSAQAVLGRLRPYPFKVVKWKGGVDVENAPYSEQLRMLKQLSSKVKGIPMPETAVTTAEKESLMRRIKNNEHPDTAEGVIEWHLKHPGGDPRRIKLKDSHEVVIRSIFKAESKRPIAGGFEYSWTADGPVVGRVGTGFSEEQRRRMLSHPKEFIGNIARVKSQSVYGSGAMRAPSFYAMHIEKNAGATATYEAAARGLGRKYINSALMGAVALPIAGAAAGAVTGAATAPKNITPSQKQDRVGTASSIGSGIGALAFPLAGLAAYKMHGRAADKLFNKFRPEMEAEMGASARKSRYTGAEQTRSSYEDFDFNKAWEEASRRNGYRSSGGGYRSSGGGYRSSNPNSQANQTKAHPTYTSSLDEMAKAKTKNDAKAAYRQGSFKYHPDKQSGKSATEQAEAAENFKRHSQAWEDFQKTDQFSKMASLQKLAMKAMFDEMEKMGHFYN